MRNNRTLLINIRVTSQEKQTLAQKSQQLHMSLSDYLRCCGLRRKLPSPVHSDTELELLQKSRQLRVIATGLQAYAFDLLSLQQGKKLLETVQDYIKQLDVEPTAH